MSTNAIIRNLRQAATLARDAYQAAILEGDETTAAILEGRYDRVLEEIENFEERTGEIVL